MLQSTRLRALLAGPNPLPSIGIYDCFSARVAAHAGIPVLSISGNALTASVLGFPDLGLITMSEVVAAARNIANSVDVPVLADGDTGYGNSLNAMRTIREFEAAGIAGLSLEDQVFPKRSSTIGKPAIIPVGEMVVKLKAACEARRTSDFIIIGRTAARSVAGVDGTIERAVRYCEAGADMIFVSSLETPEEMRKVCAAVPRPVKINVIEGNPPAKYTMSELFSFGFRLVGYAGILQRAAGKAMQACIETFRREETTEGGLRDLLMTTAERYEVLDVAYYKALEKRLAESLATEK